MPPDPITILQPPLTLKIRLDSLVPFDSLIQAKNLVIITGRLKPLSGLRKRKRNPIQRLEQRQIRIRQLPAIQVFTTIAGLPLKHTLKIAEELGHTCSAVVGRALLRFVLLVLVVRAHRDRVVCVVRFVGEPIEHREREAVDVKGAGGVGGHGWREPELLSEVHEDIGCLEDCQVSVLQDGRGEGGWVACVAGVGGRDLGDYCFHSVLNVCCVGVGCVAIFEGEADEFAAVAGLVGTYVCVWVLFGVVKETMN